MTTIFKKLCYVFPEYQVLCYMLYVYYFILHSSQSYDRHYYPHLIDEETKVTRLENGAVWI